MNKSRLEAFSDGVLAIIITIMVLELRIPEGETLETLRPLIPVFLSYVLSFVFLGIYWSNHHHLLQAVRHVNGAILWANLHLLFWLSLIPAIMGWMGETHFAPWPLAAFGVVLLMAAVAYYILTRALLAEHEKDSVLAVALGRDFKGKVSIVFYVIGIAAAFWSTAFASGVYVLVAIIWLVPDRRFERTLRQKN
ncbi:MAG TPA: TMEM175 family protein [Terriglobia bacterium]|nr:TMEM175 family protein [Terriglobia bacterium]